MARQYPSPTLVQDFACDPALNHAVLSASTWPFNPRIVRELVASLVAPILIYGLKIAMGLSGGA